MKGRRGGAVNAQEQCKTAANEKRLAGVSHGDAGNVILFDILLYPAVWDHYRV